MTPAQASTILRQHNRWRRDNDGTVPMGDVVELGRALDAACAHLDHRAIADRITAAAVRWVEAVAAIPPAHLRYCEAGAATHTPLNLLDGTGGHSMFELRTECGDNEWDEPVTRWVYTDAVPDLVGTDASKDPLLIARWATRAEWIKAKRAAGSARGALLRMTRAAIARGDLKHQQPASPAPKAQSATT